MIKTATMTLAIATTLHAQALPEVTNRATRVITYSEPELKDFEQHYTQEGGTIGAYAVSYLVIKRSLLPGFNPHYDTFSVIIQGPQGFYGEFRDKDCDGPNNGDELFAKEGGTGTDIPETYLQARITVDSIEQRLGSKVTRPVGGNPEEGAFERPSPMTEQLIAKTFGLNALYLGLLRADDSWTLELLIDRGVHHLRKVMREYAVKVKEKQEE